MRRLILLALCFGCGSEWASPGPLLVEGRINQLAATQTYRSKELRLTGLVVSTGKKPFEHGSARTDGRWVESPATKADVEHPFVQIRDPEHPSPDFVTCYLDGDDAAVPTLANGVTAHVHGFFLEYAIAGGHVEAVLDHCTAEEAKDR